VARELAGWSVRGARIPDQGCGWPSFSLNIQMLNNVLGVDSAGGKLRTIAGQHSQEPFPALVDERDFVEVHPLRRRRHNEITKSSHRGLGA
jgi:hypothetical protein